MDIADLLAPGDVLIGVRAPDKISLLQDLSERAGASLGLPVGVVAEEITKRERLGSTGMGRGVAIPHARLAEVRKPYGILARLQRPIDFEAIDNQPVDLVFVLLLPAAAAPESLNALASVSRRLHRSEVLAALRAGADADALFRAVTEQSEGRRSTGARNA